MGIRIRVLASRIEQAWYVYILFDVSRVQVQSVKRQDRRDARDVDEDDSGDMEAGGEDATGKRVTGDCTP